MKTIKIPSIQKLILVILSCLVFNHAIAKSDSESTEKGHSKHATNNQPFRGVFYGVLPCKDCPGTKATLSLKNKNNYLLVTQPSKNSAREFFEKGKYTWDDETQIVTLTPKKNAAIRTYKIDNESSLTELSPEGKPLKSKQKNTSYTLSKREVADQGQGQHTMH